MRCCCDFFVLFCLCCCCTYLLFYLISLCVFVCPAVYFLLILFVFLLFCFCLLLFFRLIKDNSVIITVFSKTVRHFLRAQFTKWIGTSICSAKNHPSFAELYNAELCKTGIFNKNQKHEIYKNISDSELQQNFTEIQQFFS